MKSNENDVALGMEYRRFISSGLLYLYSSSLYKAGVNKGSKNNSYNNLLMGKWLTRVQKQKLFKRDLAENINLMIRLHKSKGGSSSLADMFESHYLENKTTDLYHNQYDTTELYRIKLSLNALNMNSWVTAFPLDIDPEVHGPYLPVAKKELFSLSIDWEKSINEDGTMSKPLRAYSTEVLQEVVDAFYDNGFYIVVTNKSMSDERFEPPKWNYSFDIFPNDEPTSGIEIPSRFKG